jgi:hypothetical protein
MAHIIAASDVGPRGSGEIGQAERAASSNFILLCPACHTIIDKVPEAHPAELIRGWKRHHTDRIASVLGARPFDTRVQLRGYIEPFLAENRSIFLNYGPDNDYRHDPESEIAAVWQGRVRARILPNNRRILLALDCNRGLLIRSELEVLELFRQHVYDFERRHLGEGTEVIPAARFPAAMATIGADE